MVGNDNVTLYCSFYNKETDCMEYKKVYLRGVNIQTEQVVAISDKGLNSADKVSIFVPFDVDSDGIKYVKPVEYKRLNSSIKNNYFTFNPGDKLVKGLCDLNIDRTNIRDLENLYDDVYSIISIATNNFGSPCMHHWEVGCK